MQTNSNYTPVFWIKEDESGELIIQPYYKGNKDRVIRFFNDKNRDLVVKYARNRYGYFDVKKGIDVSILVNIKDGFAYFNKESQFALNNIKNIIESFTAKEYADFMIEEEKVNFSLTTFNSSTGEAKEEKPEYYEYMRQTWHWEEKPTLEACVENSYISKLNQYADFVKMYTGWVKNGKLFVLNKEEKFVSFIYDIKKDGGTLDAKPVSAVLYTHYNPLNVDCIEESIAHEHIFNQLFGDGKYDISTDEHQLIGECELLIEASNIHEVN